MEHPSKQHNQAHTKPAATSYAPTLIGEAKVSNAAAHVHARDNHDNSYYKNTHESSYAPAPQPTQPRLNAHPVHQNVIAKAEHNAPSYLVVSNVEEAQAYQQAEATAGQGQQQ